MDEKEKTLNIRDIFGVLWRYKWVIVIMSLVGALLMFVKVQFLTADYYEADARMYVINMDDDTIRQQGGVGSWDIEASRLLSSSYIEILKSRSFLQNISDAMEESHGTYYSAQQLRGMIDVQLVNETELIIVTVRAGNPVDARNIAKKFVDKAPEQMQNVFASADVKIIDEPVFSPVPVDRGIVGNTILGFLLGGIIGVILAFVLKALDRKIHGSEALVERYDFSVLGEID
ncbi:MAG: hypothetical protein IKJ55_00215 [Clostridia bacterium]|nr:hypothetical protein [Clostridia bacterium]